MPIIRKFEKTMEEMTWRFTDADSYINVQNDLQYLQSVFINKRV